MLCDKLTNNTWWSNKIAPIFHMSHLQLVNLYIFTVKGEAIKKLNLVINEELYLN